MESLKPDQWEEVNSSHITAIGTRDDYLIVQFRNGTIYRYPNLASHYTEIISAESIGKYFHQNVRHESSERLRDEEWPEE